jgi:hypothetical protein
MNKCVALSGHACVLRLTLCGVMLLASACSLIVDTTSRQCESQDDCGALGLEGMECIERVCQAVDAIKTWDCLGNVARPASGEKMVSLAIRIADVLTKQAPADLAVKFCPKLDVDCSHPLAGAFYVEPTGRLIAQVQAGFDGYIELSSAEIIPALFFVTLPVWQDTIIQNVMPLVSAESFRGIAEALGTELDLETLGDVYALASDCAGAPAPGVRFEVDRQTETTKRYYMVNSVPVGSAIATDAAGGGGFLNIASGFTSITGFVASSGARIGESAFIVRAGAISYPLVLPVP